MVAYLKDGLLASCSLVKVPNMEGSLSSSSSSIMESFTSGQRDTLCSWSMLSSGEGRRWWGREMGGGGGGGRERGGEREGGRERGGKGRQRGERERGGGEERGECINFCSSSN